MGCCGVGIRWRCNSVLGHAMTCTPGRCYAMLNLVEVAHMVDAIEQTGWGRAGVGLACINLLGTCTPCRRRWVSQTE